MLSRDEVKHIAKLARIGLEDREIEKFRTDLSAVLDSFAALQAADVSGVEVIESVSGRTNALRDDVSRVPDPAERGRIVDAFPRKSGDALLVKAVF